jgi:hypothetical protein
MANTKYPSGAETKARGVEGVFGYGMFANTASDYSGGAARVFQTTLPTSTAGTVTGAYGTTYHVIDQPMRLVGAVAVAGATDFTAGVEIEIGLSTDLQEFCTGVALTTGQPGVLVVLSGTSTAHFGGGTTVSAGDVLAVSISGGATTNGVFSLAVFAVPRTATY